MSGAVIGSTAGAGAAAAAAHAAKMRDEEENMTKYNGDELEKWEFKIVRSNFARFKKYEVVQKLCAEEAKPAGNSWRSSTITVYVSNVPLKNVPMTSIWMWTPIAPAWAAMVNLPS